MLNRLHRVTLRTRRPAAWFCARDPYAEGAVYRISLGWLFLKVMVRGC